MSFAAPSRPPPSPPSTLIPNASTTLVPSPQHPGCCSWVPTWALHLQDVPRAFLLLGNGLCCWLGGSAPIAGGARAPGRWLLFKPRPLFCSSPLCASRGFCCRLKRLNGCCICRRGREGRGNAQQMPRAGGAAGRGVPSIPHRARTPAGAAGRAAESSGEPGLCNAGGRARPLVKAPCGSCPFPLPIAILRPVATSPAGAGTSALRHLPPPRHLPPSVRRLLLAGFLALPSLTLPLHAWLAARLGPCGGEALPELAVVAPGLPWSAAIIQAGRMRPSSSSVCVSAHVCSASLASPVLLLRS